MNFVVHVREGEIAWAEGIIRFTKKWKKALDEKN
jgi:hypothetical protein